MIKAIETRYKGYRFRSRLEARWAVFFDALGIKWEYEKEGYDLGAAGWYLPDFWLPDQKVWIEVKGDDISDKDMAKVKALRDQSDCEVLVIGNIEKGMCCYTLALAKDYPVSCRVDTSIYAPEDVPGWGMVVLCPVCGDYYVHIGGEPVRTLSDSYEAWDGRGEAVRIPMYCEQGHRWHVRFGFHKGCMWHGIENVYEEEQNVFVVLANGDKALLDSAIAAARAARFEHGETPR